MNKYKCCMGKVGDAWIFSADMLLESVVGKIDKLVRLVFEVGKYRLNRKKKNQLPNINENFSTTFNVMHIEISDSSVLPTALFNYM